MQNHDTNDPAFERALKLTEARWASMFDALGQIPLQQTKNNGGNGAADAHMPPAGGAAPTPSERANSAPIFITAAAAAEIETRETHAVGDDCLENDDSTTPAADIEYDGSPSAVPAPAASASGVSGEQNAD